MTCEGNFMFRKSKDTKTFPTHKNQLFPLFLAFPSNAATRTNFIPISSMKRQVLGPRDRTNPLIWCAAIICAFVTVLVIIAGFVAFVGYLTIKPKVPQIGVATAQLDSVYFDQTGLLTVQVTVVIRAQNDNKKARATFYKSSFDLTFQGQKIAQLVNLPYDVEPNSTVDFNYVSQSTPIPLNPEQADFVNLALRQGVMSFELKGSVWTRWKVWLVGSLKFLLHLDCILHLRVDKTVVYPRCSSKS